jgi:hypothetical protein
MNWKTILYGAFFAIFLYFYFQDALRQHEKLLRMSPAQQAEQLKSWRVESEAEAEHDEDRSQGWDP